MGHESTEKILVFDSGLGGLSLISEIQSAVPNTSLIYLADNALFPYGDLSEEDLTERLVLLFGNLIEEQNITAAVIACNTASTVILDVLRQAFSIPFVGTVPAIKPACSMTKTGLVSVLATPGTVSRAYTQKLITDFAGDVDVHMHGSSGLARIAEDKLMGRNVNLVSLREEMAPAFKSVGNTKTDVIVLGCTHYPHLKEELSLAALWPVTFLDVSEAIARRLKDILDDDSAPSGGVKHQVFLTAKNPELTPVFKQFGFDDLSVLSV